MSDWLPVAAKLEKCAVEQRLACNIRHVMHNTLRALGIARSQRVAESAKQKL
jgi:hypothetical protein